MIIAILLGALIGMYIVDDDTVLGDAYKTADETCSNKEVQQ